MNKRAIKKIYKTKATLEGAGVHLQRGFGFQEIPTFDPFLLFDDFSGENTSDYIAGFPWHPHRGIETVTYMLNGTVEHQDSMGNKGVIGPGCVQWMTAGSGIVHQEMPQESPGGLAGFQLWVNLPAKDKMMTPRYQDITPEDIPVVASEHATVRIIAGEYAHKSGPVRDLMVSPTYLDVSLGEHSNFTHTLPAKHTVVLYVVSGSILGVNDEFIYPGNILLMTEGESVEITAGDAGARFLLIAGAPIGEPIAWYGPIVMNTQEELVKAFQEFHDGTFIK